MTLKIKNMSKEYNNIYVLNDINLDIVFLLPVFNFKLLQVAVLQVVVIGVVSIILAGFTHCYKEYHINEEVICGETVDKMHSFK